MLCCLCLMSDLSDTVLVLPVHVTGHLEWSDLTRLIRIDDPLVAADVSGVVLALVVDQMLARWQDICKSRVESHLPHRAISTEMKTKCVHEIN